jgi:hypothetical protein
MFLFKRLMGGWGSPHSLFIVSKTNGKAMPLALLNLQGKKSGLAMLREVGNWTCLCRQAGFDFYFAIFALLAYNVL